VVALHDPLAVLEAAVAGTLRTTSMPLEVVCDHGPTRGAVVAADGHSAGGHAVRVAVDADLPSINAMILERLKGLG
jgi:pyrimidine-specific ribonucleoside hydrolase